MAHPRTKSRPDLKDHRAVLNRDMIAEDQIRRAGIRMDGNQFYRTATELGVETHDLLCAIGRAAEARDIRLNGLKGIRKTT